MNAIDISNLSFYFPATRKKALPKPILSNLTLNVKEGEIFGLLGPNGGGKTTLFRILSTALQPQSGVANVSGFNILQQAQEVRKNIGVVFQNPSLDRQLTVDENLTHQGRLYGLSGNRLKIRIVDLLTRFHLKDRQHDLVEHLSGGLQRRVEIIKGLLHNPSLLLMDEPSTGLDPGARRDMWSTLVELKKNGVTVLLTTHLMEEGEKCDRLAILHHGRLRALGTPSDLKSKIGGDVISIQTSSPEELSKKIQDQFQLQISRLNGTVRIEKEGGHQFIPKLVEAFPGMIQAITVGKPTLEDVFVHETGERLWGDHAQ